MLKCKVKPSLTKCKNCMGMAEDAGTIPDCKSCIKDSILIGISPRTFLNEPMAIVSTNGKLEEVYFYQISDVKE